MFRRMRNTNLRQFGLVVALLIVLGATGLQAAQVDYFLKIEGIEGESTTVGHEREIQIESFSWGVSNVPIVGGGGTGKAVLQDLTMVTRMSKASPKLMLACCTGQGIPSVSFVAERANVEGEALTYFTVTLENAMITSYQTGGSLGDVVPTDQISLNFTKITFEYIPLDENGRPGTPVTATYDVAAGTAS